MRRTCQAKGALSSAERLRRTGADVLICPDNTIHQALEEVRARSPLPWLSIAEVVTAEASRRGLRRLGILGTRLLMEGPVYREACAPRGLDLVVPERLDRERIDAVIFDELVTGQLTAASRGALSRIIERLKEQGCDGVVLGCTELPLLLGQEDAALPLLDSTRLLGRAALRWAAEHTAAPDTGPGAEGEADAGAPPPSSSPRSEGTQERPSFPQLRADVGATDPAPRR